MMAQRESLGMVFIRPNSDRRRKRRPGAKRRTFIFTDTAKLSTREDGREHVSKLDVHLHGHSLTVHKRRQQRTFVKTRRSSLQTQQRMCRSHLQRTPHAHIFSLSGFTVILACTVHTPGSSVRPGRDWLPQREASWPQGHWRAAAQRWSECGTMHSTQRRTRTEEPTETTSQQRGSGKTSVTLRKVLKNEQSNANNLEWFR